MAGRGVWGRRLLGGLLVACLLAGGAAAWRERSALQSWFYVRNLARATESNRAAWADRVANLGEAALPALLDCLTNPDEPTCRNARAALERMSAAWGAADPRTAGLAARLARSLNGFSPAGRRQVFDLAAGWLAAPDAPPDALASACAQMVEEAAGTSDADTQAAALELCPLLLNRADAGRSGAAGEALHAAQELVRAALRGTTANRLRAIRLTLHPGMAELLEPVVALLSDDAAEVRRAALLAVGPARDVVHDDQLLPCLHDPDPEVRRLAVVALGGRGLRPEYIELGRLLTDPRPATRLQVLDRLDESPELDGSLWLRRLSLDPSPAVRAAAVRAMAEQTSLDLGDRIEQMARADSSPTVCQLARYYLKKINHKDTKDTEKTN